VNLVNNDPTATVGQSLEELFLDNAPASVRSRYNKVKSFLNNGTENREFAAYEAIRSRTSWFYPISLNDVRWYFKVRGAHGIK